MRRARLEIEGYINDDGDYYFEMAPEYNGGDLTDTLNLLAGMGVNVISTRLFQERQLGEWVTTEGKWDLLTATQQARLYAAQYEGFQRYLIEVSNCLLYTSDAADE